MSILVCDIKDAFLTIPQRELVIVEVPCWIPRRRQSFTFLKELCRCVPGQGKAALHWNEHFEISGSVHAFPLVWGCACSLQAL